MTETQRVVLGAVVVIVVYVIWLIVQIVKWARKRKNGGKGDDKQ